jgi:hypothetical protein
LIDTDEPRTVRVSGLDLSAPAAVFPLYQELACKHSEFEDTENCAKTKELILHPPQIVRDR